MKINKFSLLLIIALCFSAVSIFAEGPIGPQNVQNTSERFDSTTFEPYNITVLAGNITSLNIHSWTLTRTWAGFYGNITGTIILSDVNNNTMYDWNDASPAGRVYASRDNQVDWTTIDCASKANVLDTTEAVFTLTNGTDRNGKFPMDAPNRTFVIEGAVPAGVEALPANFSDIPNIFVGPVSIDPSTCPSTSMHNSTGYVEGLQNAGNNQSLFREITLADTNGNGDIVYTAFLENDMVGFDGQNHDFQMIVGENGHGTDTAVTNYYFYVELV